MQYSRLTLAFKPLIPLLSILYLLPHHLLVLLAVFPYLLLPFHPLNSSRFFNRMLEVSEAEALNCYTFFRLIPLTLSISRNLPSIPLSLSGFLDSLLCSLIAPTPDLALSLLMSHTLTAASSLFSSRAYPSLNFLSPLFLRLTPTLIM